MNLRNQEPFRYNVSVYVTFTAEDLRIIKACSEVHYDFYCKTFFEPGNKGYDLRRQFWLPPKDPDGYAEHTDPLDDECPTDLTCSERTSCTFGDLDLIAKILEVYSYLDPEQGSKAIMLGGRVYRILKAINAEATRLMDDQKERAA